VLLGPSVGALVDQHFRFKYLSMWNIIIITIIVVVIIIIIITANRGNMAETLKVDTHLVREHQRLDDVDQVVDDDEHG